MTYICNICGDVRHEDDKYRKEMLLRTERICRQCAAWARDTIAFLREGD